MSVDLGGGANKLTLDNSTDTGTVKNVGTLIGGTGNDTITLGTVAKNASISLGAGSDITGLANGANSRHGRRTPTPSPAPDRQRHHLRSPRRCPTSMSIDLGAGSNKLTLGNFANTGTVTNVNTLVGGTGADTITLATAVSNGSINLGSGADYADAGQRHQLGHRLQRQDADRRDRQRHDHARHGADRQHVRSISRPAPTS